jgi:hypothetical protein
MRLGCSLLARMELASAAGVRAPWSVGSCERRDGPRAISIAHLRRASISSGLLSASEGTDGCAVAGTDLGSAGGPDPGGVSADLGGAVGTDTGSVEREAALSCARRSFANKRLKMLGAAVGKLWTTQDARCDCTLCMVLSYIPCIQATHPPKRE